MPALATPIVNQRQKLRKAYPKFLDVNDNTLMPSERNEPFFADKRGDCMTKNSNVTAIARGRRRTFELGEECTAKAKLEAEQLTRDLGRKPSIAEKLLLEQVAYLTIRVRTLRAWSQTREAEDTTRLLANLLSTFEKLSKPAGGRERQPATSPSGT
jgi:hypothetical protein